jgi:hypothetical protein
MAGPGALRATGGGGSSDLRICSRGDLPRSGADRDRDRSGSRSRSYIAAGGDLRPFAVAPTIA